MRWDVYTNLKSIFFSPSLSRSVHKLIWLGPDEGYDWRKSFVAAGTIMNGAPRGDQGGTIQKPTSKSYDIIQKAQTNSNTQQPDRITPCHLRVLPVQPTSR